MIKCATAQEWVDAAIAAGMEPYVTGGPVDQNGVPIPGEPTEWLSCKCIDVDHDKKPENYPDGMGGEIGRILSAMGRDARNGPIKPFGSRRRSALMNIIETEKEAPATVAEMAVLNFAGADELSNLSDKEIADISKRRSDEIYTLGYLALAQMRMGKDELVAAIRENADYEVWFTMLKILADGQDAARALLQFCQCVEARLTVALATVEQEMPDDPDPGEEIPESAVA